MSREDNLSAETVIVACAQLRPIFGDVEANLAAIEAAIGSALAQGAGIVVLPELADTGYVFESRDELERLAGAIPDGASARRLADLAARHGIYIVSGLAERDGDQFYNSAAMFGPDGYIGKYRKLHLWNREKLFFAPGDLGLPVFPTRYGQVGVAICYDGWFPETFRQLAFAGAVLVCIPTNWVPMPGHREDMEPMANVLHKAAAHSNGLYIACADRVGTERGQPFIGRSLIVAPTGLPLAGPASPSKEEIVVAMVDLGSVEARRKINEFNHVFGDRRPDVYG